MKNNLHLPRESLVALCRRWQIRELALFGSVLRDDFRPDSDVDVLVTFQPEISRTLFDLVRLQSELESLLSRKVDVVERKAIEKSENFIRREHILKSLEPIYVEG